MRRPKLLDLYCGGGGAEMGYHRAGFQVSGVDKAPQPNYPFPFRQGDAIEILRAEGHRFDFVHASPPCQAYCTLTQGTHWYMRDKYPRLIEPTRDALIESGLPYVIENVPNAPIRKDLTLCGEMFGLRVLRHRNFECHGFEFRQRRHRPHRGRVAAYRHGEWFDGPYYGVYGNGGGKGSIEAWQDAMGIDWLSERKELAEAIPPAYTRHIGKMMIRSYLVGGDDVIGAVSHSGV